MPQSKSVAIVKNYYNFFNKKDYPGMLSLLSPDVVHYISQGDAQKGLDAFALFLKHMDRHYDEKLDEFTFMSSEDGQHVAARFSCHGTYLVTDEPLPPAKNQKYSIPVGAFFEIKNEKITRIDNHYNLTEWVRIIQSQ